MKIQKQFKIGLLALVCSLIISSCSQSRYGSLSKVKTDKSVAKTEKKYEALESTSIKDEGVFLEENFQNEIESNNNSASVSENKPQLIQIEKNEIIKSDKVKRNVKINKFVNGSTIQKIFKSPNKITTKTQTLNKAESGRMSGLALAGFICGVIGFILTITIGWSFLLGTLATVFSAIGLGETINGEKSGKGLAIAGLVLGILCITLFWIIIGL